MSDTPTPHSNAELADTISHLIDLHILIDANYQNHHMTGGINYLLREMDKTLANLLEQYTELAKAEGGES